MKEKKWRKKRIEHIEDAEGKKETYLKLTPVAVILMPIHRLPGSFFRRCLRLTYLYIVLIIDLTRNITTKNFVPVSTFEKLTISCESTICCDD